MKKFNIKEWQDKQRLVEQEETPILVENTSWTTNTLGYLWEEDIEEMLDEDGNYHVEELFASDDAYGVCPSLIKLAMDNGKSANNVEFLINKFLKFATDEMGWRHPRDFRVKSGSPDF